MPLLDLPPEVIFTLLCFAANSVLLMFYFSNVISVPGSRRPVYRDSFLVSFLGSAVGATFSLAVPALPEIIPNLDLAIALVIVTWILLLHYRYDSGWFEAVFQAVIGAIIYVIILALASGFYMLLTATS